MSAYDPLADVDVAALAEAQALRFLPWLTDADCARMIGYPDRGPGRTTSDRMARKRAREAFEKLAADGVIDFDEHRGRFRIFGPTPAA